jgi:hypothetical protein
VTTAETSAPKQLDVARVKQAAADPRSPGWVVYGAILVWIIAFAGGVMWGLAALVHLVVSRRGYGRAV